MKRLLALLMIGLMLITVAACSKKDKQGDEVIKDYLQQEIEVDRVEVDGAVFRVASIDSETLTVTGYEGKDVPHKVVVPEMLGDKRVVAIADEAFYYQSNISEIELPRSVKTVGSYAFAGCSMLQSVTLHRELTSIGIGAFYGCTSMTAAAFEAGSAMTAIPKDAFRECTALVTLNIPSFIKTVGANAFFGCTALETLTVEEGVLSLGDQCFQNCTALANVTLPASLADTPAVAEDGTAYTLPAIGYMAFNGCRSLFVQGVHVPAGSVAEAYFAELELGLREDAFEIPTAEGVLTLTYTSVDGACATVTGYTYKDNDGKALNLTELVIPEKLGDALTVVAVGDAAFYNIATLKNITLPVTVEKIGSFAFSRLSGLENITLMGTTDDWKSIDTGDADDDTWIRHNPRVTVTCSDDVLPSAMPEIAGSAEALAGDLNVTLEFVYYSDFPNATVVGYRDCYNTLTGDLTALRELVIPSSLGGHTVYGIKNSTFAGIAELESVVLPETLGRIGANAFAGSETLAEIKFGGTVEQWKALTAVPGWNKDTPASGIECSDLTTPTPIAEGSGSIELDWYTGKLTLHYTYRNYTDATVTGFTYVNDEGEAQELRFPLIPAAINGHKVVAIADGAFASCAEVIHVTWEGTASAWEALSMSAAAWPVDAIDTGVWCDADGVGLGALLSSGTTSIEITDSQDNILTLFASFEDYSLLTVTGYTYKNAAGEAIPLKKLELPETYNWFALSAIADGAFAACDTLESVVYGSSAEEWKAVEMTAAAWHPDVLVTSVTDRYESMLLPTLVPAGTGSLTVAEGENTLTVNFSFENYTDVTVLGYTCKNAADKDVTLTAVYLNGWAAIGFKLVGIADGAFANCDALEKVVYSGSADDWKAIAMTAAAWPADKLTTSVSAEDDTVLLPALVPAGTSSYVIEETSGNKLTLTFTYADYTDATVTGYTYTNAADEAAVLEALVLPEMLGNFTVVGIADGVFAEVTTLKTVSLPATLKKLGANAFAGCTAIEGFSFAGTLDEWSAIAKGEGWKTGIAETVEYVTCKDGALAPEFKASGETTLTYNLVTYNITFTNYNQATITGVISPEANTITTLPLAATINGYTVVAIADGAFASCNALEKVIFNGSAEDWKAIAMTAAAWNEACLVTPVYAADGTTLLLPAILPTGEGTLAYENEGNTLTLKYTFVNYTDLTVTELVSCKDGEGVDAPLTVLSLKAFADKGFKVVGIADGAFASCNALEKVIFNGSAEDWKAIAMTAAAWNEACLVTPVYAADGTMLLPTLVPAGTGSLTVAEGENTLTVNFSFENYTDVTVLGYTCKNAADEDVTLTAVYLNGWAAIGFKLVGIADGAFANCDALEKVVYGGSAEDWKAIAMTAAAWNEACLVTPVCAADGTMLLPTPVPAGTGSLTVAEGENTLTVNFSFENYTDVTVLGYTCKNAADEDVTLTAVYLNGWAAIGFKPVGIADGAFANCDALEAIVYGTSAEDWLKLAQGAGAWHADALLKASVLDDNGNVLLRTISESGTIDYTVPGTVGYTLVLHVSFADYGETVTVTGYTYTPAETDPKPLETLAIPEIVCGKLAVTHIADGAFKDIATLKTVTLPASITKIGAAAFAGCRAIEVFGYEGTVDEWMLIRKGLGWREGIATVNGGVTCTDAIAPAFYNKTVEVECAGGTKVTLTYFYMEDTGEAVITGYKTCVNAQGEEIALVDLVIPEMIGEYRVVGIAWEAFRYVKTLKSVTLGNLAFIGDYAFADCAEHLVVNFRGTTAEWNASNLGQSVWTASSILVFPTGDNEKPFLSFMDLFGNVTTLTLSIDDGGAVIEGYSYKSEAGDAALTMLDLTAFAGQGLKLVGIADGAFAACDTLEAVVLNGSAEDWKAIAMTAAAWNADTLVTPVLNQDGTMLLPTLVASGAGSVSYDDDWYISTYRFTFENYTDATVTGYAGENYDGSAAELDALYLHAVTDAGFRIVAIADGAFADCDALHYGIYFDGTAEDWMAISMTAAAWHQTALAQPLWRPNRYVPTLPTIVKSGTAVMTRTDWWTGAVSTLTVSFDNYGASAAIESFSCKDMEGNPLTAVDSVNLSGLMDYMTLTSIKQGAFATIERIGAIYFNGTAEQWKAFDMTGVWHDDALATTVYLTDANGNTQVLGSIVPNTSGRKIYTDYVDETQELLTVTLFVNVANYTDITVTSYTCKNEAGEDAPLRILDLFWVSEYDLKLVAIEDGAFADADALEDVHFEGTAEEWGAISMTAAAWNENVLDTPVQNLEDEIISETLIPAASN